MSVRSNDGAGGLRDRVQDEMLDTFDEELEMEIDDDRLTQALDQIVENPDQDTVDRSFYFKELLRLQRELIKLQDWVVATKAKIVVVFEGRDSAGKGGAIKRVTQRLNPRSAAWLRYRRRPSASAPNGISSVTSPSCLRGARSHCSTVAGTTASASSA
jgi:polyphosphate kinase 2 (PPK2 family)